MIAAIIPAYNEEQTVADVVKILKASPLISEVFVISDASTDATACVAQVAGAIVYEMPGHSGKGEAMLQGVALTQAPIIAFFDADLLGLTLAHIAALVTPVLQEKRIMNVGLRDRGLFVTALTFHLPLISGERALKREVIENIPRRFMHGYMIESALNYYCRSRGLIYGAIKMPGLAIRKKYQKVHFAQAVLQYLHMFYQIAKAIVSVRMARIFGKF